MKNLLAGIDIGTTGLKVSLYKADTGEMVERAYREYSLSFPQDSWVEMDPDMWWERLCDCMREIRSRGEIDLGDVSGIGITCTNSLVLLDSEQKALRPAIMQLDQRAVQQADSLKERYGQETVFEKTGNRISQGAFWGPSLQWVRENEAELFKQTRYFLVPTSFLVLRLTGVYCIDHSRATTTMLYNIHTKCWDPELSELFGIQSEFLPPIYKSHQVIGVIDGNGEQATGFLAGTPVIAGGMDTIGALVGMGADSENAALIMGSVGRLCIESSVLDIRFMNTVNYDASNSLIMTPVNSAGVAYKWAKNLFFCDASAEMNIYQTMDQMGDEVPPGSEGLIFMPYLTGERSPIWDPYATGSFMNMTIKHKREHFVRAVLEGVGMAITQNYEILKEELGIDPPYFLVGGGGACSRIWMQILSDMLGKPLYIPENLETETMGAAMLAGVGSGVYSDLREVQQKWIKVSEKIQPRMDIHAMYKRLLNQFKEVYARSKMT